MQMLIINFVTMVIETEEGDGKIQMPTPEQALTNAEVLLLVNAFERGNEERIAELGQIHEVVWIAYKQCLTREKKELAEKIRQRFPDIVEFKREDISSVAGKP
jgi:hypothetical protein